MGGAETGWLTPVLVLREQCGGANAVGWSAETPEKETTFSGSFTRIISSPRASSMSQTMGSSVPGSRKLSELALQACLLGRCFCGTVLVTWPSPSSKNCLRRRQATALMWLRGWRGDCIVASGHRQNKMSRIGTHHAPLCTIGDSTRTKLH